MSANIDLEVVDLVGKLMEGIDGLVEAVAERARYEPPANNRHVDLSDVTRRSVAANLRSALAALAADAHPPEVPGEALEEARSFASAGVPLDDLVRTYRQGHAAVLDVLLEAVDALPDELRGQTARSLTRGTFAYIDAVLPHVANAYHSERERLTRSTARRRREAVLAVLDGEQPDAAMLGQDLRATHVGVAVEGRASADALPAGMLVVEVTQTLTWGWARQPPDLRLAEGQRVGVGEPGQGVDGFRRTHRQAVLALRVAHLTGAHLTKYGPCALETRALHDEPASMQFVREELGPLCSSDARTIRLRTTLEAYLSASRNATAAAARLGVNDRTVAYRIRSVETLLGHPIDNRATEIAVALRWHALLFSS